MADWCTKISRICFGSAGICWIVGLTLFFVLNTREAYVELKRKIQIVRWDENKAVMEAQTISIQKKRGPQMEQTALINRTVSERFVVTKRIIYIHSDEIIL